jgi:hypothetical protein
MGLSRRRKRTLSKYGVQSQSNFISSQSGIKICARFFGIQLRKAFF